MCEFSACCALEWDLAFGKGKNSTRRRGVNQVIGPGRMCEIKQKGNWEERGDEGDWLDRHSV